jgi:hypothetical protein
MKKIYLTLLSLSIIVSSCSVFGVVSKKERKKINENFKVDKEKVYFNNELVAIYRAKTYSLDNNELVEEYNLNFVGNPNNKEMIGNLIDFVSDRHSGAEVEVEIDSKNTPFNL